MVFYMFWGFCWISSGNTKIFINFCAVVDSLLSIEMRGGEVLENTFFCQVCRVADVARSRICGIWALANTSQMIHSISATGWQKGILEPNAFQLKGTEWQIWDLQLTQKIHSVKKSPRKALFYMSFQIRHFCWLWDSVPKREEFLMYVFHNTHIWQIVVQDISVALVLA